MDEQGEVAPVKKRGRPKKSVVKTPAQRQADSREKRKKSERQLNVWISAESMQALSNLAKSDSVTKKLALEKLILNSNKLIKLTHKKLKLKS
ncbi:MAG: hypothetical protein ACYCSS_04645 [Sulfuriferula sp.]